MLVAMVLVFGYWSEQAGAAPDMDALRAAWRAGEFTEVARGLTPLAESGDARAQLLLGYLRETAATGRTDHAAALHWYREAAEQGIPEAQYALGLMHEMGYGTPVDAGEAQYWYGRAIDHGLCPGELDVEAYWDDASPLPVIPD